MKKPDNRCLYCWEVWDGEGEFHPKCNKKFFGTRNPPILEHGLDEMEKLATEVVRTHVTVPGVQPKISLDLDLPEKGREGRLTLVGLWGRYILKPPTKKYPSMPEVEDATMHLAEAAGIRTVPHSMIRLKSGELAYITKRIDRKGDGKIAMEDMCQITERLTEDKYKGSLEQVGRAIREHSTQPGLDTINFFEVIVFCYLTGNSDMHLKNFSLWRPSEGEIQLAPAYDLVATKLLLPQDLEETALALNGKKKNLRRKDFKAIALNMAIPEKTIENTFNKFFRAKESWIELLDKSFMNEELRDAYKELLKVRFEKLLM
jgi:serine/threonine-protein kinase HipA